MPVGRKTARRKSLHRDGTSAWPMSEPPMTRQETHVRRRRPSPADRGYNCGSMPALPEAPHRAAAPAAWPRAVLSLLPLVALACAGGPSANAPRTVASNPPSAIAEVAEPLPVTVRTLTQVQVHREAPAEADAHAETAEATSKGEDQARSESTMVILDSDQNLSWTTYRDLEGHLVIELPGTRYTAPAVIENDDDDLLIARVEITAAEDGFRGTPTTRLRVMARRPAVHALEARGTGLALRFDPVAPPPERPVQRAIRAAESPTSESASPSELAPSSALATQPPLAIESESLGRAPVIVQPVRHPDAVEPGAAAEGSAEASRTARSGAASGDADAITTLAEDLGIKDSAEAAGSARRGSSARPTRPSAPSRATPSRATPSRVTPSRATPNQAPAAPREPAPARHDGDQGRQLAATGRTVYDVFTRRDQGTLVVEVRADGPLAWSAFRLGSPPRFVVDLPGVFNQAGSRTVPADHPRVARARLGQFQPRPNPVARLVLDLYDEDTPIAVVRTPTGLELRIELPR